MLFEVLRGTVDIKRAKDLLPNFDRDEKECIGWDRATLWVDWWLKERHLRE